MKIRSVTEAKAQPGRILQMQASHTACFSLQISQQTSQPINHRQAKQSASQAVPSRLKIGLVTGGMGGFSHAEETAAPPEVVLSEMSFSSRKPDTKLLLLLNNLENIATPIAKGMLQFIFILSYCY